MITTFAVKHSCFSCYTGNKTHKFPIFLLKIITAYFFLIKGRKKTLDKGTFELVIEQIFNSFFNEDIQIKGVAEQ